MPSKYSYTIGTNGLPYFFKTEGGKKVRVAKSAVPKNIVANASKAKSKSPAKKKATSKTTVKITTKPRKKATVKVTTKPGRVKIVTKPGLVYTHFDQMDLEKPSLKLFRDAAKMATFKKYVDSYRIYSDIGPQLVTESSTEAKAAKLRSFMLKHIKGVAYMKTA